MDESSTLKLPFRKELTFLDEMKINTTGVSRYDINQKSDHTQNIYSRMSTEMNSSGLTNQTVSSYMTRVVENAIEQKTSIDRTQENLNRYDVSAKPRYMKTRRPSEEIKNSKDSLLGESDLSYAGLSFPDDIETAVSYIQLAIIKYTRPTPYSAGDTANIGSIINLPIPENLTTTDNISFSPRDTGFYGDALNSSMGQKLVSEAKASGSIITALQSLNRADAEGSVKTIQEIGKRAAYATLESANEVVGGLAGQIAGEIPNPHPTVFFKGLELRTFVFSWKLVPRSESESSSIENIIRTMRQKFLPSSSSPFIQYPHLVKPTVVGSMDVIKYKNCAVRSLTVNYTPEGTSAFFRDGKPCSVNINLDLQEIENFTSEDV